MIYRQRCSSLFYHVFGYKRGRQRDCYMFIYLTVAFGKSPLQLPLMFPLARYTMYSSRDQQSISCSYLKCVHLKQFQLIDCDCHITPRTSGDSSQASLARCNISCSTKDSAPSLLPCCRLCAAVVIDFYSLCYISKYKLKL